MKLGLVSCSKKKMIGRHIAEEMYAARVKFGGLRAPPTDIKVQF
jgi:hypothetical protein